MSIVTSDNFRSYDSKSILTDVSKIHPDQIRNKLESFVGSNTWMVIPSEIIPAPWGDNFIVTVGATYIASGALGIVGGVILGIKEGWKLPNWKLKLNKILNSGGKTGSQMGNSFASMTLIYTGISNILNYSELYTKKNDNEMRHNSLAAGLTGLLYRLPMGLPAALTFGVITGGSMAIACLLKEKFHPKQFNLSIKDLYKSYKSSSKSESI